MIGGIQCAVMGGNDIEPSFSFSHQDSDFSSSGYLEDALIEFTSKRRRFMPCPDEQTQIAVDLGKVHS